MSSKLPAIMFYPGDWMKDPALRATSLFARGLWIDLLCFMHESPKRGFLLLKTGQPMGVKHIARMTGVTLKEATTLTQELVENGVCSIDDAGVIYSRRMIRDEEERASKRRAGQRGGRMRVANERQARRVEDDASQVARDKDVMHVWRAIPAKARKSKPQTILAIDEAIKRSKSDRVTASQAIAARVAEYYKSEEGRSEFHRTPARWLDEDGFEEPTEAWNCRAKSKDTAFS